MKKTNYITAALFLIVVFSACEKEEKLWQLPPAGDEKMATINIGEAYDQTIFFKLSTGNTITKDLLSWDLAFASGATENHIRLNGGKGVQVFTTAETDFTKPLNPAERWQWDNPSNDKDSTAFGNWLDSAGNSLNKIYIVDCGSQDPSTQFQKIQLVSFSATSYTIKIAHISQSTHATVTFAKNTTCNYTYFNLLSQQPITYEPLPAEWDIQFTRYRHLYYDMNPITPYLVNGVLINPKLTTIFESTTLKFEDIDAALAQSLPIQNKIDEIGFDWKFFDLNGTGKYIIDTKKVYILKDGAGYLYKLKFIDFYDDNGTKGYPKFVYKRL